MTNKVKKEEKLSAEEICKILNISKRKCAWMLQNGMIPCKDSGKKTRRYTVLRKDLDAYIKDSAEHPEKYFIPVTFTSNNPGKREPDKYYGDVFIAMANWMDIPFWIQPILIVL